MSNIDLVQEDITKLGVDAIVNAANSSLLGGGGVDGAIHRAGGPAILEECKKIRDRQGGCKTGEAVITGGGKLKAKYVIHTVGPVWYGGSNQEPQLLSNAYRNSLGLAIENNCLSLAFPNISTGIYGYPKQAAAEIAVAVVTDFLKKHASLHVTFCCFDEDNFLIYRDLLDE